MDQVWRVLKGLQAKYGGWRFPMRVAADDDAMANASGARETLPFDCALALGPIRTELPSSDYQPEVALMMEEMATSGDDLRFSEIAINASMDEDESVDPARDAQMIGRTFGRVLCASGCPRSSLAALEQVNLNCYKMPPLQLARMCSAIAKTTTTRQLCIELHDLQELSYS